MKPNWRQPGIVRLADLAPGKKARVLRLDPLCGGLTRRRLLEFGLTPGVGVRVELVDASGKLRAYRVRGTLLALRREQAKQIWVRIMEHGCHVTL